jgi:hypothetical protein
VNDLSVLRTVKTANNFIGLSSIIEGTRARAQRSAVAYALRGMGASWRYSSGSSIRMDCSAVWTGSRVRGIREGWDEWDGRDVVAVAGRSGMVARRIFISQGVVFSLELQQQIP